MGKEDKNIVSNGSSIILTLLDKFNKKTWFQIIVGFWLLVGPIVLIAQPFINRYVNEVAAKEVVINTLNERDVIKEENHKNFFEASKHAYTQAKNEMKECLEDTKCDWLFLVEYHNGSNNIMTGISFCKFDVTLEVCHGEVNYVLLDKFKDDLITRYDVLMNEKLTDGKVLFATDDEFDAIDGYFALQLRYIGAKSFAMVNLYDSEGRACGALVGVSKNKDIDRTKIYECGDKLERLMKINNGI